MKIEYKELISEEDIKQCIQLQKIIFNLSDADLISPLFFKLIARNNPPIGISIGAYMILDSKPELIGFALGFATFENKSVYVPLMGVLPEYQNKIYGYKLSLKFREIALSKGLKKLYCVFDPVLANLARLYCVSLGCIGIKYEDNKTVCTDHDIPDDKLLVLWDFNAQTTIEKINCVKKNRNLSLIDERTIATSEYLPKLPMVFVEIPDNYIQLKNSNFESALQWRISTREILSEYINNRHYIISDCHSLKINKERKTYFLLEKQQS
jgi:predicted GNAT superfamily acetyltransferase